MVVHVNWLYCAYIVHGLHMCLKARVESVYSYQLISILFLSKDITVNMEHRYADSFFGGTLCVSENEVGQPVLSPTCLIL